MQEQFVNEFMAKITDLISDADLNIVYKQLMIHVSEYDIRKKSTEVAIYEGYLPECYEVFFVTRKIEGMSMKSLELYNMVLKHFFYCLNKKIEKITTNDIRVYLYKVQQERQLSNATLDSRRTIIHSFLEWAANEQYIGSNPCRSIRPIKYERPKRNPLTAIELEMLRNTCQTIRDAAIIEFLYSTGCRVTEMERADITDVDFAKKEVLLFGKGNKHRISYINARAELALKKYLEIREDDSPALFVSERKPHGRIKKAAIEKRVRQLGEMSGIGRRVYPHLIRHTTATDGLFRGMPVEEVQKLLGHANITTTMIYAEVSEENTKNDHKKYIV